MTTLLDAFALLAFLRDEPAADEVAEILRSDDVAIVSVNLAEVLDQLMRRSGIARNIIVEALSPVLDERLTVLPVNEQTAWTAAEVRAQHYRKKSSELSLADCMLLASASVDDGTAIATSDQPVAVAAKALGIVVIALPDSKGHRPVR